MKKLISLTLATLILLCALTSCRMPEKKDPFKEILEENPEMELPKSEVMEVDPQDIPKNDVEDVVGNYEEEFETVGEEFVCKQRKYTYKESDLVLLHLENRTAENYKVTIHGEYLDENGSVLKEETQTFDGFPSYWQNYFVFLPNMTFNTFRYTLDFEEREGKSPISPALTASPCEPIETKFCIYERVQAFGDFEKYPSILCDFQIANLPAVPLSIYCILFDDRGEIYFMDPYLLHVRPDDQRKHEYITKCLLQTTEDSITWPVEITDSVGGIVAISRENIFGEQFDDEFNQ